MKLKKREDIPVMTDSLGRRPTLLYRLSMESERMRGEKESQRKEDGIRKIEQLEMF